jgi:hypothetical protein
MASTDVLTIGIIILTGLVWISFFIDRLKRDSTVTFSDNATRFAVIAFVLPFATLLSIIGQLNTTIATIFGTVIGYVLSGFDQ